MTLTNKPKNNTQIRLLLPKSWVEELDALSDFRVQSRLALIRHLIRAGLNKELENFDDQVKAVAKTRELLFRKHQEIIGR